MKIYSYKRLWSALLCFVIALAAIIVQFLKGFSIDLASLAVVILLIAFRDLSKSISKESVKKDLIEERDERNEMVAQRSDATAFKIVLNSSIVFEVLLIILYGFFKEPVLLPAILTLSVVIAISFASSIFSGIYYEKRV